MSDSEFFSKSEFSFSDNFTDIRRVYSSPAGHTEVYEARKALKKFALKALKPKLRDDPFYIRLLRKEFEIGFRLEHPGIVHTYSFEEIEELGSCIVLEWIDGQTLADRLSVQTLDGKAWRKVLPEICEALEYLEKRQIVHRDIKPSNIMVTWDGEHAKLIDFGFADSPEYGVLKQSGGTRGYASPEQLDATDRPITHLSDTYAFGKLLKELPIPKSKKLERLINSMNAENPASRPQDAGELKKKLKTVLGYGGRRRVIWLTGVFLIMCLVIIGMIWIGSLREQTGRETGLEAGAVSEPEAGPVSERESVVDVAREGLSSNEETSSREVPSSREETSVEEGLVGEYAGGGYIYSEDYPILMEIKIMAGGKVSARYKYNDDYIWNLMEGRIDKHNLRLEHVPDPEADFEMTMKFDYVFTDDRLELSGYAEGVDGDREKAYVVLGKQFY